MAVMSITLNYTHKTHLEYAASVQFTLIFLITFNV